MSAPGGLAWRLCNDTSVNDIPATSLLKHSPPDGASPRKAARNGIGIDEHLPCSEFQARLRAEQLLNRQHRLHNLLQRAAQLRVVREALFSDVGGRRGLHHERVCREAEHKHAQGAPLGATPLALDDVSLAVFAEETQL